jgi:hypothetical protein
MNGQQQNRGNSVALIILLAALVLVASEGFYLSLVNLQTTQRSCLATGILYISILLMGAFGLWISLLWPGSHLGAYILIGLVLGGVGVVSTIVFWGLLFPPEYLSAYLNSPLLIRTFLFYVFGGILLGVGGGIGDAIKPSATRPSTEKLVGWGGPILSALGAIIGQFFC